MLAEASFHVKLVVLLLLTLLSFTSIGNDTYARMLTRSTEATVSQSWSRNRSSGSLKASLNILCSNYGSINSLPLCCCYFVAAAAATAISVSALLLSIFNSSSTTHTSTLKNHTTSYSSITSSTFFRDNPYIWRNGWGEIAYSDNFDCRSRSRINGSMDGGGGGEPGDVQPAHKISSGLWSQLRPPCLDSSLCLSISPPLLLLQLLWNYIKKWSGACKSSFATARHFAFKIISRVDVVESGMAGVGAYSSCLTTYVCGYLFLLANVPPFFSCHSERTLVVMRDHLKWVFDFGCWRFALFLVNNTYI